MDALDTQIIGLLQENARRSFSDLGRQVGLSTSATAARVRRLEAEGVILGYTILTEPSGLAERGRLEVFIDLRLDADTDNEAFTNKVADIRDVVDAVHMTGPFDYLLRAYVRDTSTLDKLLRRLKQECGAAQTQTRIALRPR